MNTSLQTAKIPTIFFLFVLGSFSIHYTYGQAAQALWPLTANAIPSVTGNITAANETHNGVTFSAYNGTNGATATNWPATSPFDANKYYQFSVTPNAGYNLTIDEVHTTNLTNSTVGAPQALGIIQYSFSSSFTSPVALGGFNVLTTLNTTSYYVLNISVTSGQTIYFRVY